MPVHPGAAPVQQDRPPGPCSYRPVDGPSDGGVGQGDDDAHLGPQPAGEQRDLEVLQVIGFDADNSLRAGQARVVQQIQLTGGGTVVSHA